MPLVGSQMILRPNQPNNATTEPPLRKNLLGSFEAVQESPPVKRLRRSNAFLEEPSEAEAGGNGVGIPGGQEAPSLVPPTVPEQSHAPQVLVDEPPLVANAEEPAADSTGGPVIPTTPADDDAAKAKETKRVEKKRKVSRDWHAKWISKGVPRPPAPNVREVPTPVSNMREACAKFVSQWIAASGMEPSNERRQAAYRARMESDQRSDYLAGREGVQK